MQALKASTLLFGLGCTVILGGWSRAAVAQTTGGAGLGTPLPPDLAALGRPPSFPDTPGVLLPPTNAGTVTSTQVTPTTTPNMTGWVHVPGALANPACVYSVPGGAQVHLNGDVTLNGQLLFHETPCPTPIVFTRPVGQKNAGKILSVASLNMNPPFTDGWVEAWQLPATADDCADATGPTQYSALTSYFTVPARPVDENDNQLLFLFLGQAPASLDQILQPVLQWGTYCNNGQGTQGCIGSPGQWTYAAWQVGPGSNINHGPWIAPAVGDVLFGGEIFLEYDGEEQVWDVGGNDQSNSSLGGIGFLVGASSSELWACAYAAVLESEANINQSNCNDWPGGASGVNFWEYPKIYNQNGTEVYPTFSSCIEPSSCIGGIEYAGTTCGFDTTQGDGAFALWF